MRTNKRTETALRIDYICVSSLGDEEEKEKLAANLGKHDIFFPKKKTHTNEFDLENYIFIYLIT